MYVKFIFCVHGISQGVKKDGQQLSANFKTKVSKMCYKTILG